MKKYILLIVFLFSSVCVAQATEKHPLDLSTSELGKYIFSLEQQRNFEVENMYVQAIEFLPSTLSKKEIEYIGYLILDTHEKVQQVQQEIQRKNELFLGVEREKREILVRQSYLYGEIYTLLEESKRSDFLSYVSEALGQEKSKTDVLEKIQTSKVALDKKVEHYNKKITSNKKYIKDSLQDSFQASIKKRFQDIETKAKQDTLSPQQKIDFYNEFLMELQDMISNLSKGKMSEGFREIRRDMIVQIMDEVFGKIIHIETQIAQSQVDIK